jgi:two-component system sensor histidine kinase CreC
VRIRTRIFLGFFLLTGGGFFFLVRWILDDLRPRYLESSEETLVDAANVLAALLEAEMEARGPADSLAGRIPAERLRDAFRRAYGRPLQARIREVMKTRVDLRLYVTDSAGTVLFDSDGGRDEGKDYSRWRDVYLTLRGSYGARSTRLDPGIPSSSVMHVAAPIHAGGRIAGVLTLAKPTGALDLYVRAATPKIAAAGLVAALAVTALGLLLSALVTRPINRLTAYARAIRDGRPADPPALGRSEIGEMGRAFEEMREALEGRKYVERYVHTLTHELKSPLSSVRGAAELLQEDMPPGRRSAFLANIRSETDRMRDLIDRMLDLAALEKRRQLEGTETLDLSALARDVLDSLAPALARKELKVEASLPEGMLVRGEAFLLRQALSNLIDNAVAFSPRGARLSVKTVRVEGHALRLEVADQGPGLPEYARGRVFEKFFSLQRPDTGRKSSGLGLTIVAEVTRLHDGEVRLENRPEGGLLAAWTLPAA